MKKDTWPSYSPAMALEIRGELTQAEMAALVGYMDAKRWSEFETGVRSPRPRSWELALIKRGMHPLYGPRSRSSRKKVLEAEALLEFTPAMALEVRGELTQAEMAALCGFGHGDRWSEFETGVRQPGRLSWELVLVKCDRHPLYGPRAAARRRRK